MQAVPRGWWFGPVAVGAGLIANLSDCLAAGPQHVPAKADSLAGPAAALAYGTASADVPVTDTFGLVLRMVLSLVAVLVVIWLAVQLVKRLPSRVGGGVRRSCVRVVDRAYLAPKKAICIVQIGGRYMALGVTDSQITPLTELDEEEACSPIQPGPDRPAQVPFASLFKDVRSRLSGGTPEETS